MTDNKSVLLRDGSKAHWPDRLDWKRDDRISEAEYDVLEERSKQRKKWSDDHDDNEYQDGDLACVAGYLSEISAHNINRFPWASELAGRHNSRQRFVMAAAFLIAEIDRMDRLNSIEGDT